MNSIYKIRKHILIVSFIKLSALNNLKLRRTLILWLFPVFIFQRIINESYAQGKLDEYTNNNHNYIRNNEGSISDSSIVNNEKYQSIKMNYYCIGYY